jgi:hypothetical protein
MYFDESLAGLLMLISSGSGIEDVHPGKAKITDGCTPVDMEFTCQIGYACRGITRKDANKLLDKIVPKYVDKIADAPLGEKVHQCYDLDHFKPKPHFEKLYAEVLKEIRTEYGIDLVRF